MNEAISLADFRWTKTLKSAGLIQGGDGSWYSPFSAASGSFHDGDPWREPKPEPSWDSVWITIGTGIGGRR